MDAIDSAVRFAATSHPLNVECKERALTAWFLLRLHHLPAELIVGLDLYPLSSHCWCRSESHIIADVEERCAGYTPIFVYDPSHGPRKPSEGYFGT